MIGTPGSLTFAVDVTKVLHFEEDTRDVKVANWRWCLCWLWVFWGLSVDLLLPRAIWEKKVKHLTMSGHPSRLASLSLRKMRKRGTKFLPSSYIEDEKRCWGSKPSVWVTFTTWNFHISIATDIRCHLRNDMRVKGGTRSCLMTRISLSGVPVDSLVVCFRRLLHRRDGMKKRTRNGSNEIRRRNVTASVGGRRFSDRKVGNALRARRLAIDSRTVILR